MRRMMILTLVLAASAATGAYAQGNVTDLRVDKLEKEMRAVQRKVFGATGATIAPEIGGEASGESAGSTAPVADLTARIDALEQRLKTLTGQMEQDQNRLRKLEEALKATDARLKTLEGAGAPPSTPTAIEPPKPEPKPTPVAATPKPTPTPVVARTPVTPPKAPAPSPASTKVDPARKALVAKVELPDSGDAAEDAYAYGYRLWDAKLFPEAQTKLKEFVGKYPKHKRTSFAHNLLGRAYLDEGKPALAAKTFYDNFTQNPRGERAPDSLYYLGVSLTKLKKFTEACKAYDEFDDVYGATAASDLKARVQKGRLDAKCTA